MLHASGALWKVSPDWEVARRHDKRVLLRWTSMQRILFRNTLTCKVLQAETFKRVETFKLRNHVEAAVTYGHQSPIASWTLWTVSLLRLPSIG